MLTLSQHQFFVSMLKWQANTSSHCLPAHLSYTKCHTWITAVHQFGPVKLHVKYVAGQGPLVLLPQGYSTVSTTSLQLCKALEKPPGSTSWAQVLLAAEPLLSGTGHSPTTSSIPSFIKGIAVHTEPQALLTHISTGDLSRQTTDNKSKRQNKKVSYLQLQVMGDNIHMAV